MWAMRVFVLDPVWNNYPLIVIDGKTFKCSQIAEMKTHVRRTRWETYHSKNISKQVSSIMMTFMEKSLNRCPDLSRKEEHHSLSRN